MPITSQNVQQKVKGSVWNVEDSSLPLSPILLPTPLISPLVSSIPLMFMFNGQTSIPEF